MKLNCLNEILDRLSMNSKVYYDLWVLCWILEVVVSHNHKVLPDFVSLSQIQRLRSVLDLWELFTYWKGRKQIVDQDCRVAANISCIFFSFIFTWIPSRFPIIHPKTTMDIVITFAQLLQRDELAEDGNPDLDQVSFFAKIG